jgi:hypothetical protein
LIDTAGNQVDITRSNDDGTYTLCTAGEGHFLLICASPPQQPCAERIIVAAGQLWHDVVLPVTPQADSRQPHRASDASITTRRTSST